MVDLNGHAAGNGGHSQGKPTAHRDLLYSDEIKWRCQCGCRMLAGRVEDWRGIPKVEPSRCSPFPLGVPQLSSQTVNPFPAPATSHPACRFPALGAPVCLVPRVMWLIVLGRLSRLTIDGAGSC